MNIVLKGILLALVIVYAVSPIDLAPGPIDDILVAILGFVANRKIGAAKRIRDSETDKREPFKHDV